MKRFLIFYATLFAVACSSPVETYIKTDFARVVREEALDAEVSIEAIRAVALWEDMANEANIDALQANELYAKAKQSEKEIKTRLNSYKRTGSYSYIVNIAKDIEDCEAMYAKAKKLERKAKPYIDHKDKQINILEEALNNVDAKTLMNTPNLEKNDSITLEYIFKYAIGDPANMITPSEEEVKDFAIGYLTNYFVDNPTPSVVAYKYQKQNDCWYITMSDEMQYFLTAIECVDGGYSFKYAQIEDPFSDDL